MATSETQNTIETVFRMERSRLIAALVRLTRDVGLAEDLAQDALLAALDQWPGSGVPDNPAAWLMTAAKRRAIDHFRRAAMLARKHDEISREQALEDHKVMEAIEAAMDDDIGDERLSLIFTACHPVLSMDARVALTLRLIGGLTTEEIARAFLSSETTVAQRIVRAKKQLGGAGIAYEVPRGKELGLRLDGVLEVIYLIFNEGYAASRGNDLIRPQLCDEAMRLGRILSARLPCEPEVLGLLALMELQSSRFATRMGADGMPCTLEHQDRSRWDHLLIQRALKLMERVRELDGLDGPYSLQAALAACHARARHFEETDWRQIASLYDRLLVVNATPVVALNRAVAYAMAFGPETGLALIAALESDRSLQGYAALPAARADFLRRAGHDREAAHHYRKAAELSVNAAERKFLLARAMDCRELAEQAGCT